MAHVWQIFRHLLLVSLLRSYLAGELIRIGMKILFLLIWQAFPYEFHTNLMKKVIWQKMEKKKSPTNLPTNLPTKWPHNLLTIYNLCHESRCACTSRPCKFRYLFILNEGLAFLKFADTVLINMVHVIIKWIIKNTFWFQTHNPNL